MSLSCTLSSIGVFLCVISCAYNLIFAFRIFKTKLKKKKLKPIQIVIIPPPQPSSPTVHALSQSHQPIITTTSAVSISTTANMSKSITASAVSPVSASSAIVPVSSTNVTSEAQQEPESDDFIIPEGSDSE